MSEKAAAAPEGTAANPTSTIRAPAGSDTRPWAGTSDVLRAVRDNRTLSEHAKIAYLMLWSRLPAVHPSMPRLAEDMGASESTARRAVAELVKANLVKIVPRLTDCGDSDTNGYGLAPLTGEGVVSHRHHPLSGRHHPLSHRHQGWCHTDRGWCHTDTRRTTKGRTSQREGLSLPRSPSCGPSCRPRSRDLERVLKILRDRGARSAQAVLSREIADGGGPGLVAEARAAISAGRNGSTPRPALPAGPPCEHGEPRGVHYCALCRRLPIERQAYRAVAAARAGGAPSAAGAA
jgi:hypothetical protein